MDIYEAAGMDEAAYEKLREGVHYIFRDDDDRNITVKTVIQRGIARYDREAFIVGMLTGAETSTWTRTEEEEDDRKVEEGNIKVVMMVGNPNLN